MICAWCGSQTDARPCETCGKPPSLRDRYRLEEQLGRRGASTTFRATDEQSSRDVVIKELLLRAVSDAKELELFEREAQLLEQIDHPGVPQFIDHFEWKRGKQIGLYIVQEHVDGTPLDREVAKRRTSEHDVAVTLADVLDVLTVLRGHGIVHRDIKPANLLRTSDGIALVDFGAGRAVAESIHRAGSTVTGTFGYMAPEQLLASAVPASDVYGLGATAVCLLTGRDPGALVGEHGGLQWREVAPNVSAELAGLIDTMLAPSPDDRPDDLDALADDLRAFAEGNTAALRRFRRSTALARVDESMVQRPSAATAAIGITRFSGFSVGATATVFAIMCAAIAGVFGGNIAPLVMMTGVLSLFLGAIAGVRIRRAVRHFGLARSGTPVPAVVRRRTMSKPDFIVETEHRIDGEPRRTVHPVSEDRFMELAEGDELTLFVDPDDQTHAVLADAGMPNYLKRPDDA